MKAVKYLAFALVAPLIVSCSRTASLENTFRNPTDKITVGCYWYWMSDNITKEGVIADLQAMKRAGINSAFLANIGGQGVPYGKVKIFSDEWWDIVHAALKTASALDIEIGMFNCPGWSQSGGPWIEPSQTMRYLTSSETKVSIAADAGKVVVQLPAPGGAARLDELTDEFVEDETQPSPDFQDVCVLAFPSAATPPSPEISVSGRIVASDVADPSRDPRVRFRTKVPTASKLYPRYFLLHDDGATAAPSYLTLKYAAPLVARSLTVYPAGWLQADAELQAKENGAFRTVKTFKLDRSNAKTFVGYRPYAPVVVSFPATTATEFRLLLNAANSTCAIGAIVLSSSPVVENYPEKTFARLYQGPSPVWEYYQWQQQQADTSYSAPAKEQVVDLSAKVDSAGLLVWDDAPAGDWTILRLGMMPTYSYTSPSSPEGTGLEMDKINAAPVARHFDAYIGEIMRRIPAGDRRTLKVIVGDSWERGGQTFTDGFTATFKARYGYDPVPYLPVLTGYVIDDAAVSDRFLWDVRRLTADLAASEYAGGLTAEANRHGMETWLENYGDWGFSGEFLYYGKFVNRVGGEFWTNQTKPYIPVAASCAHIYNKPVVYAEAFTSVGNAYAAHPRLLKRVGDFAFADGMTRCNLHVNIQQAYDDVFPGIGAWFGTEFNRKNTWFSQMDLFTDYLKRSGAMLEAGKNIADIACFIGENVPVNCGPLEMRENEADYDHYVSRVPAGYHVDYVNCDVILNSMSVADGRLTLPHGAQYRMLVLPPLATMRPELLQRIGQLVEEGAVVVADTLPARSPSLQGYPEADAQVQALSAKIWGTPTTTPAIHRYGKGLAMQSLSMQQALDTLNIAPDFKANHAKIKFAHRRTADRDIYYVSNQNDAPVRFTPDFRADADARRTVVELWNPVTGEIRALPQFERHGGTVSVPLEMAAFESYFVVFADSKAQHAVADSRENFPALETVVEINSPWTVRFESDSIHRGPVEPVVFDTLTDWTHSDDERIKYYSGTATYSTTFTFQPSDRRRLYLDPGNVGVMAKVKVNGKYAGGAWTSPCRIDVGKLLRAGDNTLEIEVVNTWLNRLAGDSQLLPEQRRVKLFDSNRRFSRLQQAGLTGPVKIVGY
jgi:hypothetical protein